MSEYRAKSNWKSQTKAAAYAKSRDPSRYKRASQEDLILSGWLDQLPTGAAVLDCPCGTGRFISLITGKGFVYTGADISAAMMEEAKKIVPTGSLINFVEADAENLSFPDNSFDCVIVWRLLQHIVDPAVRLQILREAARVSRNKVFISFYHPLSFTALRLWIKNRLAGKKKQRGTFTHWQLQREVKSCGLELSETKSYQKFISINWFACLTKVAAANPNLS
jgi:ubiquinone/menaquinone biosynthesis C-methylase UbiE